MQQLRIVQLTIVLAVVKLRQAHGLLKVHGGERLLTRRLCHDLLHLRSASHFAVVVRLRLLFTAETNAIVSHELLVLAADRRLLEV